MNSEKRHRGEPDPELLAIINEAPAPGVPGQVVSTYVWRKGKLRNVRVQRIIDGPAKPGGSTT